MFSSLFAMYMDRQSLVWRFWSLANEDFEATKQVEPSFSSQNRHTLYMSLYRRYEGANFAHTFEGTFVKVKVRRYNTKVRRYEGTKVTFNGVKRDHSAHLLVQHRDGEFPPGV